MRQEGVTLTQRLQLLALTQRGPRAVLGAQRGLGRCWAGTHTHTHRKDMPLEGEAQVRAEANARPTFSEAVNSLLTHHTLTLNMLLKLKV